MEITEELKAKALACETTEELLALAAESGIDLTAEEVEIIIEDTAEASEGELTDEELDGVAGGASGCKRNAHDVVYFNSEAEVEYLFSIGDINEAFIGVAVGNETATVRITGREIHHNVNGWYDVYKYDRISGSPTAWGFEWQKRDRFEK